MSPSVLLISGDYLPNIGGLAGHVHELGRALSDRGHQVSVLTTVSSNRSENLQIPVHRIPPRFSNSGWIARSQIIRNTESYIRKLKQEGKADILHWHTLDHFCPALARISHPAKVFTNHTSHFTAAIKRGRHRRLRKQIGHAHAWITPSELLRQGTLELGFKEKNVHWISNGVNCEDFLSGSKETAREKLGLNPSDQYILYAGRVEAVKGTDVLLETIEALDAQLEDTVRFVIVGDHARSTLSNFEKQIDERGAPLVDKGRLIFLGPRTRSEMIHAYQAADIVILPSRNEATSLTALEAMSTSKPLIASAVGGLLQLVEDKKDGWLVPSEDTSAFANAIVVLLKDKSLQEELGKNAREKVFQEWTWDAVAAKTAAVYSQLLNGTSDQKV